MYFRYERCVLFVYSCICLGSVVLDKIDTHKNKKASLLLKLKNNKEKETGEMNVEIMWDAKYEKGEEQKNKEGDEEKKKKEEEEKKKKEEEEKKKKEEEEKKKKEEEKKKKKASEKMVVLQEKDEDAEEVRKKNIDFFFQ
jgi:hypothetical protein